jgi:hypothetical protein
VPTAVAAFVGPAARGPVDEPRHLTSWTDFERIYGGRSADSLMSYEVFLYYLNGGSAAEVVWVAARSASAVIDLGAGVKFQALKFGAACNDLKGPGRPRPSEGLGLHPSGQGRRQDLRYHAPDGDQHLQLGDNRVHDDEHARANDNRRVSHSTRPSPSSCPTPDRTADLPACWRSWRSA